MNQMSKVLSNLCPAMGRPVRMELKPERIQEQLAKLPGWRLRKDGRAIERIRKFADAASAGKFASETCRLAAVQRQPVAVGFAGEEVVVTLPGHPARGCVGGLTGAVFNLAALIG